jgi:hypothetical protein
MKISREQLRGDPKKIGKTKSGDVFHISTKGGFNIIMLKGEKETKMLGAAPHIAIAKHIAKKNAEDLVYFELSKADEQIDVFSHLIPVFEQVTRRLAEQLNG